MAQNIGAESLVGRGSNFLSPLNLPRNLNSLRSPWPMTAGIPNFVGVDTGNPIANNFDTTDYTDVWKTLTNNQGIAPNRRPTRNEMEVYRQMKSGYTKGFDPMSFMGNRILAGTEPSPVDQYGWTKTINPVTGQPTGDYYNLKSNYTVPAGTEITADTVGTPPPEEDSGWLSNPFSSFLYKGARETGRVYDKVIAPYVVPAASLAVLSMSGAGALGYGPAAGAPGAAEIAAPLAEGAVSTAAPATITGAAPLAAAATPAVAAPAAAGEYGALTAEQLAGYGAEEVAMASQGITAGSGVAPYAAAPLAAAPLAASPAPATSATPSPWDMVTKSLDTAGGYVKANPIKSMLATNALSSVLQSGMMSDVNKAQQESYANYLNAINPPETVKQVRYGALAENARTQAALTQKRIDESLAARGVRGKGRAAPTGDVAEATRKSLNDAYNMIFGQYNVPGAPGPVNYAPSWGQLAGTSTAQMLAQGLPLMLLMSKYGVK